VQLDEISTFWHFGHKISQKLDNLENNLITAEHCSYSLMTLKINLKNKLVNLNL
jgi:hypothetical protein